MPRLELETSSLPARDSAQLRRELIMAPAGALYRATAPSSPSEATRLSVTLKGIKKLIFVHIVRMPRLELGTSSLSVTRSNHLSYTRTICANISFQNTKR